MFFTFCMRHQLKAAVVGFRAPSGGCKQQLGSSVCVWLVCRKVCRSALNPVPSCSEATHTTVCPCCISKQLSITVITHFFCRMLLLFSPWFFFPSVFSLSLSPVKLRRSELTTRGAEVFRREEVRKTPSPITALLVQLIQRC